MNDLRNFILAHLTGTQPAAKRHLSVIFAASRRDPSLPGSGPRCYSPSMKTACTHCGTSHELRDSDLGAHPKVQFRCSKCGQTTVVEVRRRADSTVVISPLPSFARSAGAGSTSQIRDPMEGLKLPATKNVILKILSGPSKGQAHKLQKPRVILGREGADIPLEDPEISRHHCAIEVKDAAVSLKDLDSTNGTFFEDERVRAAVLVNGAEFRIGSSTIRVTLEPK